MLHLFTQTLVVLLQTHTHSFIQHSLNKITVCYVLSPVLALTIHQLRQSSCPHEAYILQGRQTITI